MKDIDWNEIQNYYDNNHTWRDIISNFNINSYDIRTAIKLNKFKMRNKSEANVLANKKYPQKHSEETKKKISDARIKYLKENPDKVPYLLNHYSKGPSYPENYFNDIFNDKFKYERYYQVSLYQIDFAIPNKKIAIEIDGEQHYLDNKITKSDQRKNEYLIKHDWEIIRIRWSDYQKYNRQEKEQYTNDLIDYINEKIKLKPEIEVRLKNNYCKCGKKIWKTSKMCKSCAALEQKRKVENRPELEELIKMVNETSLEAVGRKYGVTGNAVKKWLKSQKDFNLGKTS